MNGDRRETDARQCGYTLVELMAAMVITLFVMAGVYTLMLQNQRTYEQQSQLADAQQAGRVAIDLMTREVRMAGADPSGRAFSGNGCYPTPVSQSAPAAGDILPLTVAKASQIRVKMDRPVWSLAAETLTAPAPPPVPYPKQDCSGNGNFNEDGEDELGDGYLNDEAEDVEYIWDSATKRLSRSEYRTDPVVACRSTCATYPAAAAFTVPIAENIIDLQFKYYDTESPTAPCPVGVFATQADYETARDACDAPLPAPTPPDLSAVRRVRMLLVVETEKRDPINPAGGTNKLTLSSQATLRNRR